MTPLDELKKNHRKYAACTTESGTYADTFIDAAFRLGRVSGAEEVVAGVGRKDDSAPMTDKEFFRMEGWNDASDRARAVLEGIRGEV